MWNQTRLIWVWTHHRTEYRMIYRGIQGGGLKGSELQGLLMYGIVLRTFPLAHQELVGRVNVDARNSVYTNSVLLW